MEVSGVGAGRGGEDGGEWCWGREALRGEDGGEWCWGREGWIEVSGVGAGRGGEDGGEWCWGREGWMEGRSNGERYREGGEL